MKKIIPLLLHLFILLSLYSCSSTCYKVYETKEIIYNIEGLSLDATTKEGKVISETDVDHERNNKTHFFNKSYSYSKNYRNTEVINLKTHKRFKKANKEDEVFKEVRTYQGITNITPKSTGEIKTINGKACKEYYIENEYKVNLLYYTSDEYPHTHLNGFPYLFKHHLVAIQSYVGYKEVSEIFFAIKEVSLPSEFKDAIAEVRKLE